MKTVLEVKDLVKTYKTKKNNTTAVNGISFSGNRGEVLGILGPNGSGKTTTIKSIATIINYDKGQIKILGHDNAQNKKNALSNIGAVLEGARNIYWRLTPMENMIYFAGLRGLSKRQIQRRSQFLLENLDLADVANKTVGKFSRGMQQKVAIACALIHDPPIVLLDEPTLGLDVETSIKMKSWITKIARDGGIFTLVTSHDMKFIEEVCDRVIILKDGHIVSQDSISNLKTVFIKKTYRISLSREITDQQRSMLKNTGMIREEKNNGSADIFLSLSDTSKIYDVFDALKVEKQDICSMDILQDDFEDVFLDILNNSEGTGHEKVL